MWDKSAVFDQSLHKLRVCGELELFSACDDHSAFEVDFYLVAHADGVVKAEEKQKMMGFLRNSDVLSIFKADEIISLFDKYAKQFEFDCQIGQASALQAVAKLKGKADEARLMVRVCCAIGAADGHFDESEKAAVRAICAELGLNPADFDLT